MKTKSFGVKCLVFLFILIAMASIGAFAFASADHLLNQSLAPAPQYPKNASGETYGSLLYATSPETEPDLVKAMGVDGTVGYVRITDLNGPQPKTPEEAIALSEAVSGPYTIPLYQKDGKTVIGKYEISPGLTSADRNADGK